MIIKISTNHMQHTKYKQLNEAINWSEYNMDNILQQHKDEVVDIILTGINDLETDWNQYMIDYDNDEEWIIKEFEDAAFENIATYLEFNDYDIENFDIDSFLIKEFNFVH